MTDMPGGNNTQDILARIRFFVDKGDLEKVNQETGKLEERLKQSGKAAEPLIKKMGELKEKAESLNYVAMRIGAIGAAITGPMLLAANKYVQVAGQSEQASRRWIAATKSLEDSTVRVGRVVVDQALPYLEKAADIAEQLAKYAEEHPDVIKAGLSIGGNMVVLGGIGTILANVVGSVGALAKVLQMVGVGGTAAGGAAAGGGLLSTLGIGAGVLGSAYGINELAQKFLGPKWGKVVATILTAGTAGIFQGAQSMLSESGITGALSSPGTNRAATTPAVTGPTTSQMKAYLSYRENEQRAETTYQQQRAKLTTDFYRQEAEQQEEYQRNRVRALAEFARNEARAEQDYYRNRAALAKRHGREEEQAEREHQKNIRRMAEDHSDRMLDLADERDALGMWKEMQSYEKERRRAEEDYRDQASLRDQQYADEIADMEAQYVLEKQRRAEEFALRQKQEAEDYAIRQRQQRDAFQRQLNELEENYYYERVQRRNAFNQQLAETAESLEAERLLRQRFTQAMLNDLQAAIASVSTGTNNIQNGGQYGNSMTYQDNRQINAGLSAKDRYAIVTDTTAILSGALR